VLKAQGRRGEVAAELHTDFPERFAVRKKLLLLARDGQRHEAELESHWLHKSHVILKFRGVDSIAAAEALVGSEVQVPLEERMPLEAGAAYVSDLAGSEVFETSDSPRLLGKIENVLFSAGEAPLLEVRNAGEELLIPFAEAYVKRFDSQRKRLEVVLPKGMLELAAAGRKRLVKGKRTKNERP
jgi:16S rRNA processing protein RimM